MTRKDHNSRSVARLPIVKPSYRSLKMDDQFLSPPNHRISHRLSAYATIFFTSRAFFSLIARIILDNLRYFEVKQEKEGEEYFFFHFRSRGCSLNSRWLINSFAMFRR